MTNLRLFWMVWSPVSPQMLVLVGRMLIQRNVVFLAKKCFFFRQIIFSTRLKVENGPNKPNWWKIAKSKKKNGKNRSKHFSPKLQNFCEIQVDNNGNTNLNSFLLNTNFRKNRFSGCFFNFQLFNFKFPKKLFCL